MSKGHFGLGLANLLTHLKKMQVCRMYMLKHSQDDSSKNLYDYMRERNKPPLNGLCIPIKPRVWKLGQHCCGSAMQCSSK